MRQVKKSSVTGKLDKVQGWYRKAICHKMSQTVLLRSLLLATGKALLVETACLDDKDWSLGIDEKEIQHLLTKPYIGPDNFLRWMLSVERTPKSLSEMGKNLTGIVLMEIRQQLQESQSLENILPLASPVDSAISGLLSHHLIAFTPDSVFHPFYPAREHTPMTQHTPRLPPSLIHHEDKFFTTVQHYVCTKQAEIFKLPPSVTEWILEVEDGHEANLILTESLEGRFLSPEDLYNFEHKELAEIIKNGLRVRLEQHQAALRALLDTGDAFLVYCQRFLTSQMEFSIGMREHDLRAWMQWKNMEAKELAGLCTLPLWKRPPFLGGNRLGFILMELRREFTLRGVFPQKLPELNLSPEDILGSDSLKENMDIQEEFDCDLDQESTLWPSPLLLLAKEEKDERLWERVRRRKVARRLLPGDMEMEGFLERGGVEGPSPSVVDPQLLHDMHPNTLRHLVLCLTHKIKGMFFATQMQEAQLKRLDGELGRIRDTRRELEKKQRLRQLGLDLDPPGWNERNKQSSASYYADKSYPELQEDDEVPFESLPVQSPKEDSHKEPSPPPMETGEDPDYQSSPHNSEHVDVPSA